MKWVAQGFLRNEFFLTYPLRAKLGIVNVFLRVLIRVLELRVHHSFQIDPAFFGPIVRHFGGRIGHFRVQFSINQIVLSDFRFNRWVVPLVIALELIPILILASLGLRAIPCLVELLSAVDALLEVSLSVVSEVSILILVKRLGHLICYFSFETENMEF